MQGIVVLAFRFMMQLFFTRRIVNQEEVPQKVQQDSL